MSFRDRFKWMASLVALLLSTAAMADPAPAPGERPISAAEQKIFLDDHLGGIGASRVLRYRYRQSGSLDKPYDGPVVLTITPKANDRHGVAVAYLDGEHAVALPALDDARANPVILYFLEQDVREMHRRLGGSENYFRRRIRLALADAAEVRAASVTVDGRQVDATEVVIRPFVDDPMKAKLGAFENKSYAFALSDRVPGQVLRLRSLVAVDGAAGSAAPLLEEVLMFENAAR
jgi:hypothetical protein